jgi:GxxExxY protein
MRSVDELATIAVDVGLRLHKDLGPGLLESVYEQILFAKLVAIGLSVDRQKPITINFEDVRIENAFRIDLLIENRLLIEIKSVEQIIPVHAKQVLTYLRLMDLPLGLLMNFGAATFKEGVRRLANNHDDFASLRLGANQIHPLS